MTKKILKYEIQEKEKKGSTWVSLSNRQDRDSAIAEAIARVSRAPNCTTRVVAHDYDTDTHAFDTHMIYASEDGPVGQGDGTSRIADAPARKQPKKQKTQSATRILVTLMALAVVVLAAVFAISQMFHNNWFFKSP